jgi:hypothetical protein
MFAGAEIAALDLARDIGQSLRIQSGEKRDVVKFGWCYHKRQYTTARRRFVRYNAGLMVGSGEEKVFHAANQEPSTGAPANRRTGCALF